MATGTLVLGTKTPSKYAKRLESKDSIQCSRRAYQVQVFTHLRGIISFKREEKED
jgi:hypothetical protein